MQGEAACLESASPLQGEGRGEGSQETKRAPQGRPFSLEGDRRRYRGQMVLIPALQTLVQSVTPLKSVLRTLK